MNHAAHDAHLQRGNPHLTADADAERLGDDDALFMATESYEADANRLAFTLRALTMAQRGPILRAPLLRRANRDELPADDLDIYAALPLLLDPLTPDATRRQLAARVLDLLHAEPETASIIRDDARALMVVEDDDEGPELSDDDVPY